MMFNISINTVCCIMYHKSVRKHVHSKGKGKGKVFSVMNYVPYHVDVSCV